MSTKPSHSREVPYVTPTLTKADLPEIIQRYRNGESMQDLATESPVSTRTLYRWMLLHLGEGEYQQAISELLADRVAEADFMLLSAKDQCQIARAREVARFARMDLERRRPELYGQKQQMEVKKISVIVDRREDTTKCRNVTPEQPFPALGSDQEVSEINELRV